MEPLVPDRLPPLKKVSGGREECDFNPELICPNCERKMLQEHSHYKCPSCGYRSACCW